MKDIHINIIVGITSICGVSYLVYLLISDISNTLLIVTGIFMIAILIICESHNARELEYMEGEKA